MAIISKIISEITPHLDRFRVRLKYTFTDGRIINIGPFFVQSQNDAEQVLIDRESNVLSSMQDTDAESAVDNDLDINQSGEASNKQVARQYLKRAMQNEDPNIAYLKLKKAQDYFILQGWSDAQIKSNLNITDIQWSTIVIRYQYLCNNLTAMQDFQDVLSSDTGVSDL